MSLTIKEQTEIKKIMNYDYAMEDVFGPYNPLYVHTNENLRALLPDDFKIGNSPALVVTGSGDIPIEVARLGIPSVECFDINVFAKHMLYLKIAAIRRLSHEEFICFFFSNNPFDKKIYESKIRPGINSNATRDFWDYVLYYLDVLKTTSPDLTLFGTGLFENNRDNLKGLVTSDTLYNKDNFEEAKKSVKRSHFYPYDSSLAKLPPKLLKQKYQLIYLSNIAEYLEDTEFNAHLSVFKRFVETELDSHLSDDGLMVVAYLCYFYKKSKAKRPINDIPTIERTFDENYEFIDFSSLKYPGPKDAAILHRRRTRV